MKRCLALLETLPWGTRVMLFTIAAFQLASSFGAVSGWFSLAQWLGLNPPQVWHGKFWPLLTHAFLPSNWMDLIFEGFALVLIARNLERVWSSHELLLYAMICALGSGVMTAVIFSGSGGMVTGLQNLMMSLLVAWRQLLGHERITLWGGMDRSVNQTVMILSFILGLLTFMSLGRMGLIALIAAGGVGWLYFQLRWRWLISSVSQSSSSQRIQKLEL